MNLSLIGLVILTFAWFVQLGFSWEGKKEIHKIFLISYITGVIILVIDGFINGLNELAILNTACAVLALLVLLRIGKFRVKAAKRK